MVGEGAHRPEKKKSATDQEREKIKPKTEKHDRNTKTQDKVLKKLK